MASRNRHQNLAAWAGRRWAARYWRPRCARSGPDVRRPAAGRSGHPSPDRPASRRCSPARRTPTRASTRRGGHRCGRRAGWACPSDRSRQGRGKSPDARRQPISGSCAGTETTTTARHVATAPDRRHRVRPAPRPPEVAHPRRRRSRNTLVCNRIRADRRNVRRACALSACMRNYPQANFSRNPMTAGQRHTILLKTIRRS